MQLLQLGAWLDAELLDQDAPPLLKRLERLRLTSRAVQREHQRGTQTLPERLLGDERLEFAHQLGVPAASEIGLNPLPGHFEAEFLESSDVALGKPIEGKIRQRCSAPERECVLQRGRCLCRRLVSGPAHTHLELTHIEPALVDVQHVTGATSQQASGAEQLA